MCAWIKTICDFPMWERIVVAITTASWAFAISDCCSCISNLQKDLFDTQFPLVDTAKCRISQIKELLLKQRSKQTDESTIEIVNSCEKKCGNLLRITSKMNKCSKVLEVVSVAFTFSAFLLFLCVLSFNSIYNYFIIRQDGFTVLSFGMILLAQFLTTVGSNYITKAKKEYTEIINGWEALLHSYETEEECNAD